MSYTPPPPGTKPFEGWWTEAWNAILRRTEIRGGPGIACTRTDSGVVVGLAGVGSRTFEARITAAPPDAPTDPAACVYAWQAFGQEGLSGTNTTPKYGRPTRNNEWMLWPARVGDRCYVVRETLPGGKHNDELWVLTEAISAKPCGSG